MDKLIITALRGKTAAVLFENGRAVRIDFEPEAAEEETEQDWSPGSSITK